MLLENGCHNRSSANATQLAKTFSRCHWIEDELVRLLTRMSGSRVHSARNGEHVERRDEKSSENDVLPAAHLGMEKGYE
jgi:hypothetical protein